MVPWLLFVILKSMAAAAGLHSAWGIPTLTLKLIDIFSHVLFGLGDGRDAGRTRRHGAQAPSAALRAWSLPARQPWYR
jgi:hypothetical protein